jgi:hypothetical protein
VDECVFEDNQAVQYGGGVTLVDASPIFTDCVFLRNRTQAAGGGGGASVGYPLSAPSFERCQFVENSCGTSSGGAAVVGFGATSTFVDCEFTDNTTTESGGALLCWNSQTNVTVEGCRFLRNDAVLGGGGILAGSGAEMTVIDCTFHANSAGLTAGAYGVISDGVATITGSVFSGNSAPDAGSVLSGWTEPTDQSSLTLSSCTIYGTLESEAVAIGPGSPLATMALSNTIIAFSADGPAAANGDASNWTLTCCDIYGNAGGDYVGPIAGMLGVGDNICEDPLFCDAALGDLTLCETSPCAPEHSPGTCDLIGAWPVSCVCTTAVGEGTADTSWGAVKSFYR